MSRKYKLLKWETLVLKDYDGNKVSFNARRIQALRDIPRHNVKAGDIGGYVNSGLTLSHKGDCWIGDNAKVLKSIISILSYIRVKGNALINKEAEVLLLPKSYKMMPEITICNNVLITDNVLILTDDQSRCSHFLENFQARDNSLLYNVERGEGDAKVFGSAFVEESMISDNAQIFEKAVVRSGCEISGNVQIFGNSSIDQGCKISQNVKIYGETNLDKSCEIGDEVIIKDNAKVGAKAKIFGNLVVGGDTLVPQQSSLNDLTVQQHDSKYKNSLQDASPDTVPSHSVKIFNDIKSSIDVYQKDIINLIKYPTMSDLTDDYTLEMFASLKEAELYDPVNEVTEFKQAVANLTRKFMAAESNARRISLSKMNDDDKVKIETAGKMFRIASSDSSSETDKKNAFVQGFKKLEGVMAVPEVAVEEFRIRIGLPELEEL